MHCGFKEFGDDFGRVDAPVTVGVEAALKYLVGGLRSLTAQRSNDRGKGIGALASAAEAARTRTRQYIPGAPVQLSHTAAETFV